MSSNLVVRLPWYRSPRQLPSRIHTPNGPTPIPVTIKLPQARKRRAWATGVKRCKLQAYLPDFVARLSSSPQASAHLRCAETKKRVHSAEPCRIFIDKRSAVLHYAISTAYFAMECEITQSSYLESHHLEFGRLGAGVVCRSRVPPCRLFILRRCPPLNKAKQIEGDVRRRNLGQSRR